ncbi:MAG: Zc3h12a-like ribonuclease [Methanobrevibacter sp.]|nr:Zc3h12a-like ribonuclease [Candidatus Methanovirga australis]
MKVVIDASNVASFGREEGSKAKLKYLLSAVDALEKRNDSFVIIADASLRHNIDEKEKYIELVDNDFVEEVETGNNADHFILNLAEKEHAKIISNDKFRDFSDEFHDINYMRIPFSFDDDDIILKESEKPKKVKNILQKICDEILINVERKFDVYNGKKGIEFSPLNIAKESIIRMDKFSQTNMETKIEGVISKIPMFGKVMDMIESVEASAPHIIFVLVHPKNYKEAIGNAGSISITIRDRLHLEKNPLIIVRNDLFMKPDVFELNIIYSDEVLDESPFDIEVIINPHDASFIKRNSRSIASTIAGRASSFKFPIVSVKSNLTLENPGDFDIHLDLKKKNHDKRSYDKKHQDKLNNKVQD